MTSLRSTYAAGDHPHATCVTFFSFRLSPPFPPPFSLSFSLLLPSSSLCPPLCEYSSSSSSSSSYLTSLVLFFLYLCPRTQSLALFLSLSVSVRPLLRIYESTRLYKWTHCSFLGQHVARGSLLSFKKGVVFRCRASHSATRAPRKRDNRK